MTFEDMLKRADHPQVPVQVIEAQEPLESLCFGLRTLAATLGEPDDPVGSIAFGAGSELVILHWKGRSAAVRGRDLLRAWAATFDPASAEEIPQ